MGNVFQAKWWVGHPRGCSFGCLWLRKLAKAMDKTLERKNDIFGTIIYENNGKQEKKEVKGHKLHVRRKMKENNGKLRKQRPHS